MLKINAINLIWLYEVEDYVTFSVSIKNGDFLGKTNFCVSKKNLNDFANKLEKIYEQLKGTCQLDDYDSDSNLLFEFKRNGHVIISGRIGGSHEDNSLQFKYESDQTVLSCLIDTIKQYL